jgi:glycosyltransferase involved in cell wall biosynthesis
VRVLLTIHHELDFGAGAAGVTTQLAAALRGLGHEAVVFSWSDLPSRLGPRGREASFPGFVAARIRRAAREGFDVVDASTCDAWIWLTARETLGARRRGPTVVTRTHGLEHTFRDAREAQARAEGEVIPRLERAYHGAWRLREAEVTLRLGDASLFLNRADRDRAVRELGVPAGRAHLVANGIPDGFVGLPAPERRPPGAPLRVVQIGSWDPRKGAATTAAAVGPLLAAGDDVELTLLGVGAAAGEARAAFSAAAQERLTVVGRFDRGDLPGLLRDHDVVLQPSRAEGFSLALVEAMACGLAPVAAAVGAAPDLLRDDENGLLVPPADVATLRSAIERLRVDRGLVQALRTAAHARVQGLGWSALAARTASLYVAAAQRSARPAR